MRIIRKKGSTYVLRFDREEELIEGIARFCKSEGIDGGYFRAVGAAYEVLLSWYDIDKKAYSDKIFKEKLEIASLFGSVSMLTKDVVVHAHGVFSDKNMKTIGGHVKVLVVSATCEVFFDALKDGIRRKRSKELGLNLMD